MLPEHSPELSESTKLALEYAKESSERVRRVIVLLSIASIVTFVAWWNSYEHGWTTDRQQKAQRSLRYLCMKARAEVPPGKDLPKWIEESCDPDDPSLGLSTPKGDELKRVEAFLKREGFTRKQLERHIQDLQDQNVSGVLKINMPFFGLSTDVNDLGILSGIALLALMTLFRFAVLREEQNVQALFEHARMTKEIPTVMALFAMSQVFTIPPGTPGEKIRRLTRSIYWMPVVVYGVVAWYDAYGTLVHGDEFRQALDWITLAIESVTFVVLVRLRYRIGVIVDSVDRHWASAQKSSEEQGMPWDADVLF